MIAEPQQIRAELAFPYPGAIGGVGDTDAKQRVGVCPVVGGRCGADPVMGVLPRGGGQHGVRFGGVGGLGWVGGVGGVEVGVEGQGVVSVALQSADAQVVGGVVGAARGCR